MNFKILVGEALLLIIIAGSCLSALVVLDFILGVPSGEPPTFMSVEEYVKEKGEALLLDEQGLYLQLKKEEEHYD